MTEVKLGVGILADDVIKEQLIEISRVLDKKYQFSYVLDGEEYHPHLTLFQGKFKSAEDIKKHLERVISSCQKPVEVTLDQIDLFSGSFVFYDCKRTDSLQRLHETLAEQLKEIIIKESAAIAKKQSLIGLTEQEKRNLQEYGYQFVRESFRPHFTLGRISSQTSLNITEIRNLLKENSKKLRGYTFSAREAIIYRLGTDGSCVKIIKRFEI